MLFSGWHVFGCLCGLSLSVSLAPLSNSGGPFTRRRDQQHRKPSTFLLPIQKAIPSSSYFVSCTPIYNTIIHPIDLHAVILLREFPFRKLSLSPPRILLLYTLLLRQLLQPEFLTDRRFLDYVLLRNLFHRKYLKFFFIKIRILRGF